MSSETMENRISEAKRSARRKLIAALEKDARQVSTSFPEMEAKEKPTAEEEFDPMKVIDGVKPSGRDENVKNHIEKDLKVKPKSESKQQALDEADEKRQELTSKIPPLMDTPKPKLSSVRGARKNRIAELKATLTDKPKTASKVKIATALPQANTFLENAILAQDVAKIRDGVGYILTLAKSADTKDASLAQEFARSRTLYSMASRFVF